MKKSRVEILKGKLRRMGESDALHPEMPDDVANAFLAELQLDPEDGPVAARKWRPDNRNEQPWIIDLMESQPGRKRRTLSSAIDPDDLVN